jgi:hypothetical protein
MNSSKIKRPMNKCVGMSEVQTLQIREEVMLIGIGLGYVGRPNEMSMSQ